MIRWHSEIALGSLCMLAQLLHTLSNLLCWCLPVWCCLSQSHACVKSGIHGHNRVFKMCRNPRRSGLLRGEDARVCSHCCADGWCRRRSGCRDGQDHCRAQRWHVDACPTQRLMVASGCSYVFWTIRGQDLKHRCLVLLCQHSVCQKFLVSTLVCRDVHMSVSPAVCLCCVACMMVW